MKAPKSIEPVIWNPLEDPGIPVCVAPFVKVARERFVISQGSHALQLWLAGCSLPRRIVS